MIYNKEKKKFVDTVYKLRKDDNEEIRSELIKNFSKLDMLIFKWMMLKMVVTLIFKFDSSRINKTHKTVMSISNKMLKSLNRNDKINCALTMMKEVTWSFE